MREEDILKVYKTLGITKIKKRPKWIEAQCPFARKLHQGGVDKHPSFGIRISPDDLSFYKCLSGDTKVFTRKGFVPIRDLAGQTVEVLSQGERIKSGKKGRGWRYGPGVWRNANFYSFGMEELWEVRFSDDSVIRATAGHKWYTTGTKGPIETTRLRLRKIPFVCAPKPEQDSSYFEGMLHGFVFGDGTEIKKGDKIYSALVQIFGEKVAIVPFFEKAGYKISYPHYCDAYVGRLPSEWKKLPQDKSDSYWYGFISGFIAADGYAAKNGSVFLYQSDREALEIVREWAIRVGYSCSEIGLQRAKNPWTGEDAPNWYLLFRRFSVDPQDLIRPDHRSNFEKAGLPIDRSLQVKSVTPTGVYEEVYCAVEPVSHTFVLENAILTGNCQSCGVRGPMYGGFNDFLWQIRSVLGDWYPELVGVLEQSNRASLERIQARSAAAFTWSEPKEVAGIRVSPQMAAQVEMYDDAEATQGIDEKDFAMLEGLPKEALDYLHNRKNGLAGLTDETIAFFGFGYSSFAKRIAIPMRDCKGKLVNISGRGIYDWIRPPWLHSEGFRRDLYLYGEDKLVLSDPGRVCYLVEGMFDVAGLWQKGYVNVLGMLGAYISDFHIEKIVRWFDRAIIVKDGDAAGKKGSEVTLAKLVKRMRKGASIVETPDGLDPDELPIDFCRQHLGPAQRVAA